MVPVHLQEIDPNNVNSRHQVSRANGFLHARSNRIIDRHPRDSGRFNDLRITRRYIIPVNHQRRELGEQYPRNYDFETAPGTNHTRLIGIHNDLESEVNGNNGSSTSTSAATVNGMLNDNTNPLNSEQTISTLINQFEEDDSESKDTTSDSSADIIRDSDNFSDFDSSSDLDDDSSSDLDSDSSSDTNEETNFREASQFQDVSITNTLDQFLVQQELRKEKYTDTKYCSFLTPGINYDLKKEINSFVFSNIVDDYKSPELSFTFHNVDQEKNKIWGQGSCSKSFLLKSFPTPQFEYGSVIIKQRRSLGADFLSTCNEVTFDLEGTIIDFCENDLRWVSKQTFMDFNNPRTGLQDLMEQRRRDRLIFATMVAGHIAPRDLPQKPYDGKIFEADCILSQIKLWQNLEPFSKVKNIDALLDLITTPKEIEKILSNYILIKFEISDVGSDSNKQMRGDEEKCIQDSIILLSIRRSDGHASLSIVHRTSIINIITLTGYDQGGLEWDVVNNLDSNYDSYSKPVFTVVPCNGSSYWHKSIEMR